MPKEPGFDQRYCKSRLRTAFAVLLPFLLSSALAIFSSSTSAGTATIEWNASPSAGVDGYNVHYSTVSGGPYTTEDAGNQLSYTVSGLTIGQTYYFAITAYDLAANRESGFSPEVSAEIPLIGGSSAISTDHSWTPVTFSSPVSDPIVIAGPPTFNGVDPGIVRLRNVASTGFEIQFSEWLYLDGWHPQEKVDYSVFGRGRKTFLDGSVWEAESFSLSGTGLWQTQFFAQPFPAPPLVFLTIQTFDGTRPITVRARNVTANGFDAAFFGEEAQMNGHVSEIVGYLAIYSPTGSGAVNIAGVNTPYLLQTPTVDERWMAILSHSLMLEEERSQDPEVNHGFATLAVLALGDKLFAQDVSAADPDTAALRRKAASYIAPMEWGTIDSLGSAWVKIPLAKRYTNPVVVARSVSARGPQPGVIRLRNISADSFEASFQEWRYLDGYHVGERLFYMVAEAGFFKLGGLTVQAGKANSDKLLLSFAWTTVPYPAAFSSAPAVFTSIQTFNGFDPVTTRIDSVSTIDFRVIMDEEEALRDGHVMEQIGWIAIEAGVGMTADNRKVEVTRSSVDDRLFNFVFGTDPNRQFPVFVADVMTVNGEDPFSLRYRDLNESGVNLFIQEEQSLDLETTHVLEELSVFAAE